jgi:DNA polymerase IV
MDGLQTIYGVGPVVAQSLINKLVALGYDRSRFKSTNPQSYSVREIYKMLKDKTIWETLPEAARAYLKYLPDKAIPRAIIEVLDTELHKYIKGLALVVAGSYRRGKTTSNDADIVVLDRGNTLERITRGISASTRVEMIPPYMVGPDRASVFFKIHVNKTKLGVPKSIYTVKSDIFITPKKEYIFMLLYATGSGGFNIIMRSHAKRHGLLLNQRGLFDSDGTGIPVQNEREIFERVGITYREPNERDVVIKKKK